MSSLSNNPNAAAGRSARGVPRHGAPYARAALFLAAVFVACAALTLFGQVVFAGGAVRPALSAAPSSPAQLSPGEAYPRMPPDTDERLSAAFEPQVAWNDKGIQDPFYDRANMAGGPGSAAAPTLAAAARVRTMPTSTSLARSAAPLPVVPAIPAIPDFSARLSARNEAIRRGDQVPPQSALYSYTELRPVGVVGMGRLSEGKQRDAYIYAEPSKQFFSASVGTRFYDAELVGIGEGGVKFRTSNGTVRVVAWTRANQRQGTSAAATAVPPPSSLQVAQSARAAAAQGDDLQNAVRARYSRESAAQPAPAPLAKPLPAPAASPDSIPVTPPDEIHYDHAPAPQVVAPSPATAQIAGAGAPAPASNPTPTPSATPAPPVVEIKESAVGGAKREVVASSPVATFAAAAPAPPEPAAAKPRASFCDPDFQSDVYTLDISGPTTLGALLNDLHYRSGINFMPDSDVIELPTSFNITEAPWGDVLHTILDYNDLDSVCTQSGIVRIAKRAKLAQIREARRKSEPVFTKLYVLRYLQTTAGGVADLAGRTQGNKGGTVETLESAVREILRSSGDPRAEVRRVPGRNQLFVSATEDQQRDIARLIKQADQPPVQVMLDVSIYTVNDNQIDRLGTEFSAVIGNAGQSRLGGLSTFPSANLNGANGTGAGLNQPQSSINPGGVPQFQQGFSQPSGALGASNPTFSLGTTNIFGTAQFAVQFTAAKQRGLLFEKYNPVGTVADGESFNLESGTQYPIVIPALLTGTNGSNPTGNVIFVQAGRVASVVPQVALDENGKPDFITLQLRLENNSVDTSLAGLGTATPPVNRQSIQTVIRLKDNETVVVAGFTLDSDSNTANRVPGLSSVPVIGNAFKSKSKEAIRSRLFYRISVHVIPQDSTTDRIPLPVDIRTREQQQQQEQLRREREQQQQQKKP
jgi:type II secretory pathway component GspD/PulD (secretin)